MHTCDRCGAPTEGTLADVTTGRGVGYACARWPLCEPIGTPPPANAMPAIDYALLVAELVKSDAFKNIILDAIREEQRRQYAGSRRGSAYRAGV